MTNTQLLKDKIRESGVSITFLAEKCGISRNYLYQKMDGAVEFNQSEIKTFQDVLHLTQRERNAIFFAN